MRINFSSCFLLMISFFFSFVNVLAQSGMLDQTFGHDGIANTPFNLPGYSYLTSSALQSDGKIIAAGYSDKGGNIDFSTVRYNTDGNLDFSFGINGEVITPVGSMNDMAYATAIQSDQKIVEAGASWNGLNEEVAVVRYNVNGSLDKTFGSNGIVTSDIGNSTNYAFAVAIQNDGKIVAAGFSISNISNFTLIRYNPNGSTDNTFGYNGIVITPIDTTSSIAYCVLIQDDGKIVAAGHSGNHFALVRYNKDGILDNGFGSGGIVRTPIGVSDYINSITIQDDGKIVATGTTSDGNGTDIALVRYNQNGSLDNTFGINGVVITSISSSYDVAKSVKIQIDGKIVVSGSSYNINKDNFALVRYNPDGNIDSSFGLNGIITKPIGTADDDANSELIQSDGEIIAIGVSNDSNNFSDFALVRFDTNGNVDNSFGVNGIVQTKVRTSLAYANAEVIQVDGKILAAGYSYNGNNYDFAIACYNNDGNPDNNFGENGIVVTSIGTSDDYANCLALQNDGKFIVAGKTNNVNNYYDFVLVRYNPGGSLDSSFGTDGKIVTSFGLTANSEARSIAIQHDGKILVLGSSDMNGNDDFTLVRYNSDGSLDNTFGNSGIVTTSFSPASIDEAYSVDIQNDGKIVAAGFSNYLSYFDFALVRYNSNGSLDASFGNNGIVSTRIGTSDALSGTVKVQSDGKILLGGSTDNGNDYDFTLTRYNADGNLDSTFGINGVVTTQVGIGADGINSLAIQSNGYIVAAGYSINNGNNEAAVVRYNSDGILDNTFGSNGIVLTSGNLSGSIINSALLQNDGKIVTVGSSDNGVSYSTFTVMRFYASPATDVNETNNNKLPGFFQLLQNYPNPFNPNTRIVYLLPKAGQVKLEIYDILGKEIKTLVNENQNAGTHTIEFNASQFPSGIYIYKMEAGNFIASKKMILLK